MKPTLVLDCSMTMAWCFADESTPETMAVQDRLASEAALVPAHWFLEAGSFILDGCRSCGKRLTDLVPGLGSDSWEAVQVRQVCGCNDDMITWLARKRSLTGKNRISIDGSKPGETPHDMGLARSADHQAQWAAVQQDQTGHHS